MKRIILATVLALSLTGCAQLNGFISSLGEQKLAVTYATLKYIEKAGDAQEQADRAAKVRAVIDQVDASLADAVTVAALRAFVESKLPADLPASDRLLASALIGAVVAELEGKIDDGVLDAEEQLAVRRVLSFVRDATGYFGIA
jgi:hypothetical protein